MSKLTDRADRLTGDKKTRRAGVHRELMADFGLSQPAAKKAIAQAIIRWRARNRVPLRPIDQLRMQIVNGQRRPLKF